MKQIIFGILLLAFSMSGQAQDTIFKRTQELIIAKEISIGDTSVTFIRFGIQNTLAEQLPISAISKIKYKNGSKEIFKLVQKKPQHDTKTSIAKNETKPSSSNEEDLEFYTSKPKNQFSNFLTTIHIINRYSVLSEQKSYNAILTNQKHTNYSYKKINFYPYGINNTKYEINYPTYKPTSFTPY